MVDIPDEWVEKAARAQWIAEGHPSDQWDRAVDRALDYYSGGLPSWIVGRKENARAALTAVLPLILERAAGEVDDMRDKVIGHTRLCGDMPLMEAKERAYANAASAIRALGEPKP